ncbi:hypothetical protein, partial [Bacillus paramycoides]|uniref:hypothetical protein n=1 Tax=Bacillus paramycoides TaxID=2026194 RepID=UPI0011A6F531
INDNKILREKTAFCINISLKLMGVGYHHITIKLRKANTPKKEKLSRTLINNYENEVYSSSIRNGCI